MSAPRKNPNQYGDILLSGEGGREREALGDRTINVHAQSTLRLQKSPPEQGGGYRRFTPPSTSLTAKGLRVLCGGVAWHIACGGSGTSSFGGLNAIQTPILGSHCSAPTTTRTKSCPLWCPPSRVLTRWQALPEDSVRLCAWWFLQGFGVSCCTKTTTQRPFLTRDLSQRAKIFAQKMAKT